MENPIKVVRKAHNLSQVRFAESCGVHESVIVLHEAGCYERIFPAVRVGLKDLGCDVDKIEYEYNLFIIEKRHAFMATNFFNGMTVSDLGPPEGNPLVSFREKLGMSRMGFCKAICVHPGHEQNCEDNKMIELPEQLETALRMIQVPDVIISEINARLREVKV